MYQIGKSIFFYVQKQLNRNTQTSNVINVRTIPILENIITVANKRQDKWGDSVLGRLESCTDLVVVEAIYHSQCMTKFRLKRSSRRKRGKTGGSVLGKL